MENELKKVVGFNLPSMQTKHETETGRGKVGSDTKKLTVEIERGLYWKLKEYVDLHGVSMTMFFDTVIRKQINRN